MFVHMIPGSKVWRPGDLHNKRVEVMCSNPGTMGLTLKVQGLWNKIKCEMPLNLKVTALYVKGSKKTENPLVPDK